MEISIVIPVYNKEQYIRTCLDGALSQDFDDYEVIAVDDGSTDGSGRVCDEVARGDKRLRVVHTANGGVTAARRRGVEEARGRFIMFCDSDDLLLPHALRDYHDAMTAHGADEVIAPYQNQRGYVCDSGRRGMIPPTDIIKDYLAVRNSFPPVWAILLRRDIILQGCLDIPRDIYFGEDILFHIRYLTKAATVFCLAESHYVYNEGITTYPAMTLQYEQRYDELLENALRPAWPTLEPYFRWHQVKIYEKFIDLKQFHVYSAYYHKLKGRLGKQIPLADRIAFCLPPRLSYYVVHTYKWWLRKTSKKVL